MAKARKTRGRTKAKGAAGRKRAAKAGGKATRRAGAAGASKKLAEVQAENRRLRDEISALRNELASRTAPAEDGGTTDRQPTLGL